MKVNQPAALFVPPEIFAVTSGPKSFEQDGNADQAV
jgi:hypothetical protein